MISSVTWNLSESHRHNIQHPTWRSLSCADGNQYDFNSTDANIENANKKDYEFFMGLKYEGKVRKHSHQSRF